MKTKFITCMIINILILIFIGGCSSSDTSTSEELTSISDLTTDKVSLIAIGNEAVPAGRYGREALENLGIWNQIEGKISYATSVKEVLSQVELGSVSCGIVYATDAVTSSKVEVIEIIDSSYLSTPIVYPAAITSQSEHTIAAQCFLSYLTQANAIEVFKSNGFTIADEALSCQKVAATDYDIEPCSLTIFAAASLLESITIIAEDFMDLYPDITIITSFDSSGTLATQIEYGATADLFLSASTTEMDNLITLGFIHEQTMIELLENELVLITAVKNN